jgi:ABC-type uncharacterized transport system permease subunit
MPELPASPLSEPKRTIFRLPPSFVFSVLGVVLALAIGAVLIAAWGVSPITAYGELISGALT